MFKKVDVRTKEIDIGLSEKFKIIIPPETVFVSPDCLHKLAAGCPRSFAWIYHHFSRKAYDYALLITGNEMASEDIVQEIFLKLWKIRTKMVLLEDFNAYFDTMTRNFVRSYLRKANRRRKQQSEYRTSQTASSFTMDDSKELLTILLRAIEKLPTNQRKVYLLKKYYGVKQPEIGSAMNITKQTVNTHLKVANRTIRNEIQNSLDVKFLGDKLT